MATQRRRKRKLNGRGWLAGGCLALAVALVVTAIVLHQQKSDPLLAVVADESKGTASTPIQAPISTETVSEQPRASSAASETPQDPNNRTFTTSKGFQGITKNGVTTVNGVLIVNKTYAVPAGYANGLDPSAKAAFERMVKAAKEEKGYDLHILTGGGGDFRSYDYQKRLYDYRVATKGKARADIVSARPGHSEHETGLAIDVNYADSSIDPPEEIVWMDNNCWRFGFILRYPKDKSDETGYIYEPWHIRYLGDVEFAEELYNDGDWITLEDYFGITSVYAD